MMIWIVYDISSDRTRTQVADICLNAGLYRVQKSCFAGDLSTPDAAELTEHLKLKISAEAEQDAIYIIPTCRDDFSKARFIGKGFDVELVTDQVAALVL